MKASYGSMVVALLPLGIATFAGVPNANGDLEAAAAREHNASLRSRECA